VRVENAFFLFAAALGVLVWLGLYLRDPRLRALLSHRGRGAWGGDRCREEAFEDIFPARVRSGVSLSTAGEHGMGWIKRSTVDDELFVDVTPAAFVFRTPRETFTLPAQAGPTTAVGLRVPATRGYTPPTSALPLFPTSASYEPIPARYAHLRAFLAEALARSVADRTFKGKPPVVVYGAATLNDVLHGYQYDLLRRAMLEAGARTVRFTEKLPLTPPPGFDQPLSYGQLQLGLIQRRRG
jgi:hypothetical protein